MRVSQGAFKGGGAMCSTILEVEDAPSAMYAAGEEKAEISSQLVEHFLWKKFGNKHVFIRTVTHHYVGRLSEMADDFMYLKNASWIADDGRFHVAMRDGILNEVEPYFGDCCVNVSAIIDISEWRHPLPECAK